MEIHPSVHLTLLALTHCESDGWLSIATAFDCKDGGYWTGEARLEMVSISETDLLSSSNGFSRCNECVYRTPLANVVHWLCEIWQVLVAVDASLVELYHTRVSIDVEVGVVFFVSNNVDLFS